MARDLLHLRRRINNLKEDEVKEENEETPVGAQLVCFFRGFNSLWFESGLDKERGAGASRLGIWEEIGKEYYDGGVRVGQFFSVERKHERKE